MDIHNLETSLFDFIDQVKVLLDQETWENILLNCTKNEMLILLLLYRKSDVNMTQIADYLSIPLNTVTGIIVRMEKKEMVLRLRRAEDKRVVTLFLTESGQRQIDSILGTLMEYGQLVLASLTPEELALMVSVINKIITLLKDEKAKEKNTTTKVRKIIIE